MTDNKLHGFLLAVFVAYAGWTFFDAVVRDAAREAAAELARTTRLAAATPASASR